MEKTQIALLKNGPDLYVQILKMFLQWLKWWTT